MPFVMAMINQTTLNFFHYPPMRLLDQMRDYLKDPVPDRLIQMLEICGLPTEQKAWLYSTVMDCAPIAAPDNQGTQSIGKYGEPGAQSVHLIPIDRFHEYQRSQVQILLNTSSQNENFTVPIVVFGTPATNTFNALYKDQLGGKTLKHNHALVADGIIEGKKTAVIASGHPYRFYMAAQGEVQERLETEPRLKARTLFEWLQETDVDEFPDSTRRTFERRVNKWRSLHGPGKTVFFSQEHHPGRHCRCHSSCRSERHPGAEAPSKPALLAGATGGQRLHRLQRAGCEDRRAAFRSHVLPLRVDVQQRRKRIAVFFGVV